MGRPVVLSNNKLFVALNEDGLVHDFYYPYVGQDNLTTARSINHKIGLWVDGGFSWTDDGSWRISTDFESTALISKISMYSKKLDVSLILNDFVDTTKDGFIRHINVINHSNQTREIRIFMHQVFVISKNGRADTALYVPNDDYIYTYKGRTCLASGGKINETTSFDQFAVGNYAVEGKAGTYLDAEDGELSGNLVEHGGVDSVIRFSNKTEGFGNFNVDYWIVAGRSQQEISEIHNYYKQTSISHILDETRQFYLEWMSPALQKLHSVDEPHKSAVTKSLLVTKAHCDEHGSILASGDSSIFNYGRDYYCYSWPRDAVYALWPMIRLGLYKEAIKFFDFAKGVIEKDGYLMHKFQPDRAVGSTWHPLINNGQVELAIQEDETACVVFLLGEYLEYSGDSQIVKQYYDSLVKPMSDFLCSYVDEQTGLPHASYDLWEEKFLTTTYSTSMVIAGLRSAARIAHKLGESEDAKRWHQTSKNFASGLDLLYNPDGYFRKGYLLSQNGDLVFDDTIDISSLQGVFMLAGLENTDERLTSTVKTIEHKILDKGNTGGVARYENDNYFRAKPEYPGNPWVVATMWLAQYYISSNSSDKAVALLEWAYERMTESGILSEQYDPDNYHSLGVTPLVWSHSEVVNTILDLYKI